MARKSASGRSDTAYVIGIDLGTTNSALASVDLRQIADDSTPPIEIFEVPQVVHASTVEPRPVLPSFLYLPNPHELPDGALALPWDESRGYVVGEFAREHGKKSPQHLVSSAKSWLCNEGVDRHKPLLPWSSPDEVPHLSPIEASTRYLEHFRDAWNAAHEERLEDQEIILGVPASFDAVARDLTVEAARQAGMVNVTLLEEPQAAFYSWLESQGTNWRKDVKPGDIVLVVDIGGGTTDFSLIAVRDSGSGDLALERIAVGEHILLGGDNMDLALAMAVSQKLRGEGTRIDSWQLQVLTAACRSAKERILGEGSVNEELVIPGRGSKLIGGAVTTSLSADELQAVLLDGFFPQNDVFQHAMKARRVGLQEIGLPFESDPGITRHLARFLSVHLESLERIGVTLKEGQSFVHPTAILYNGGVLKPEQLRQRIADIVNGWLGGENAPPARVLEGSLLDLAVARGGAQYGVVRHGRGIRIRGGTARTYYIGLETPMPAVPGLPPPIKALCVVPYGMEEGTESSLPARDFGLVVGEPASFPFLGSATRRKDAVGAVIEDWEDDIQEISTVHATLEADKPSGTVVPVRLESHVTEVGTLELWFVEKAGNGRWKLEFEVREKEPAASA
ncbi:MAG: Hsp70 family protein [Candidatus Xenobia bacterium]